jgi:hypothetical protein
VRMMRQAVVAIGLVGLVVVASGCAPGGPDNATVATMQARAKNVLDRWAAAAAASGGMPAVVVVGDFTGQVGDWEMPFGDNAKRALMAGLVQSEGVLNPPTQATSAVTWSSGDEATVSVLDAQDALAAIGRSVGTGASCGDCSPLIVTSATLATDPITTTRGPARGPVWEFGIRGTAVKVTRVAIANAVVVSPMEDDPGGALAIDSASSTVGGTTVTVQFVGAPDPASKACGEDYTADAVESDLAVTVLVWRHPNVSLLPMGCSLAGAFRTATATLAGPLGDRPVLDPASGQPVALTLAP